MIERKSKPLLINFLCINDYLIAKDNNILSKNEFLLRKSFSPSRVVKNNHSLNVFFALGKGFIIEFVNKNVDKKPLHSNQ